MDGGLFFALLALVNIPLFVWVGKFFFGTWDEFSRCFQYWLKPDFMSWLDGDYWEDHWAEMKLGLFVVVCVVLVICEHGALTKLFGI